MTMHTCKEKRTGSGGRGRWSAGACSATLVLLFLWTLPVWAQTPGGVQESAADGEAQLYAMLIYNKGYVVGSSLATSGLFRQDGDTLWTHLGHVNPRVKALTYDPMHPDTLYIAASNGVLRSFDGGASWRIVTDWRITEAIDVDLDPHDPSQVYVSSAYGVWRSDDYGDTWHAASTGVPEGKTYMEALEVDETTQGRILAGTADGIYVSTDGARTWTRAGGGGLEIIDLQQSRTDPNVWLAAAYQRGLLISRDNGRTWTPGPDALADKSVHGVAIDPADARRMAAAGWETGVYVSGDGGATWMRHDDGLPTDKFYEIIFDANVPGRIWAATLEEGLFYSDDMGQTWHDAGLYGTLIFDMTYVYPPTTP